MKYLRLIDHNGIERHVFPVFVEGQDFEYEFPEPVALWFGKLQLVDELLGVVEETTIEVTREEAVRLAKEEELEPREAEEVVRCTECGWEGQRKDCGFGHNDFYCPLCGKESIKEGSEPREVEEIIEEIKETIVRVEEVQFEPETAITTGNGDTGATSSDTLESAEVTPEISDSGAASKGSKRDKRAKKS